MILFDILYIGVIGLNSYILLIHKNQNEEKLIYVICAAAFSYVLTLIILLIKLRKKKKLRETLYLTRKIFKVIYTILYLTIIMIHLIRLSSLEEVSNGQMIVIIYNIVMFIIILLINIISFWWRKVLNMILKVREK